MRRNPYNTCGTCGNNTIVDAGPAPYAVNVAQVAKQNQAFRRTIWTGCHLQMTVMCIPVGGEIGAEIHMDTDQYIRVEEGIAIAKVGTGRDRMERLQMQQCLQTGEAVFIPAGTWHNIINMGREPLKLSSVYAPPQPPHGTVHLTKQDAEKAY